MVSLERIGDVFLLDLGDADNRFDAGSVPALTAALDEVAAAAAPAALVTTATGKIWHNGLDLDHVGALGDAAGGFISEVQEVLARLLELPVPTVAAISGHAFAGGAMLALAHDVRLMRVDRGFLCLPEIDLGLPFTPGMAALIAAKLPQPALTRAAVLGERLAGGTAVALGVVDEACPSDDLRDRAVARATELAGKAKPVLAQIRRDYFSRAIDALRGPIWSS